MRVVSVQLSERDEKRERERNKARVERQSRERETREQQKREREQSAPAPRPNTFRARYVANVEVIRIFERPDEKKRSKYSFSQNVKTGANGALKYLTMAHKRPDDDTGAGAREIRRVFFELTNDDAPDFIARHYKLSAYRRDGRELYSFSECRRVRQTYNGGRVSAERPLYYIDETKNVERFDSESDDERVVVVKTERAYTRVGAPMGAEQALALVTSMMGAEKAREILCELIAPISSKKK